MFATSADPKTVEEMQELLEESIKGLVHYIASPASAAQTVAGLGGLVEHPPCACQMGVTFSLVWIVGCVNVVLYSVHTFWQ